MRDEGAPTKGREKAAQAESGNSLAAEKLVIYAYFLRSCIVF
jgi:hypothetical protein